MPSVDRSFMRELKNLDPRLNCKWEPSHCHFVVTYDRAVGEPVNLHCVETENGGFRQPDKRDLEVLWQGDKARGDKPDIRLKKAAYASELMRRERQRKSRENMRDWTKDGKIQLMNGFNKATNQSKANSAFRRIDHKPSKNTVKVIP